MTIAACMRRYFDADGVRRIPDMINAILAGRSDQPFGIL
jgi:hypothetical protein